MFSGIVAAVGRIERIEPNTAGVRLHVDTAQLGLDDVAIGDSIAVAGACLTLIEKTGDRAAFDVSRETLNCTAGLSKVDARVNLEKALRLSDRLGGHLVTGHVDGVGRVVSFTPQGESMRLVVEVPAALARYLARKGSVTLDGVSLTVNEVDVPRFSVNLIPHTLNVTTLGALQPGAAVNIEVDLIARYVEALTRGTHEQAT